MSIVAAPPRTNRTRIVRASMIAELEAALAPHRRLVPPAWSTFVSALSSFDDIGLNYDCVRRGARFLSASLIVPHVTGFVSVEAVDGDQVKVVDVEAGETPEALALTVNAAMVMNMAIDNNKSLAQAHRFILNPFIDFEILREFAWRASSTSSHRDNDACRLIRRFVSGRRIPTQIESAVMLGDAGFRCVMTRAIASKSEVEPQKYIRNSVPMHGVYIDDGRANSSVLFDNTVSLFILASFWLKPELFPKNLWDGN